MPNNKTQAEVAESYYDSSDADRFYEVVWGGEDLHIGMYEPGTSILEASRTTVRTMISRLKGVNADSKVLDLGAGFGGSARSVARTFGCRVACLNISEAQNERNRKLNRETGMEDQVTVQHGSFESIPYADDAFDVIWSQDAFLHSDRREVIMQEVDRVLKKGGQLIFTDPMQADDVPPGALQKVYERLNLESLASIAFYRQQLGSLGFAEVEVMEMTHQLRNHYATVQETLQARYAELQEKISTDYMDRMIEGLGNWVAAADDGYLAWGILHFRKA